MIVRKRDGDMVMGKPEGLMNLSTDLYVVLLVLFVVAMATVSLIALVRVGDGKSRWTQYVAIGFAAVAVLISCLIVVLWTRIRVLNAGGLVPYLIAVVVAVVVGGMVGWLLSRHLSDKDGRK
ncbi:hypothetical protein [Bifidobacterium crudilactis]|uniref:hypothetical protein n=1 Tax=Bifidobacterium crudilactis TaxID=327277 RepID=UPI00264913C7|nr:hypothetical protein [Bifidobacterium crudilactis]MDN5973520.1 hypothetical protein [Bifidobacterium crudilactis]MDN6001721.1 hypothetical protein [Bifidobacterium crudilactis]MDN6210315.1 hypothetical protein [Bifidobacterium crudilactis]MDN6233967.1 hypothetical protein [Bifidobacterium crudilactis]MDN6468295.1 hypothetical protein [Bifidobacterium crudilactis]